MEHGFWFGGVIRIHKVCISCFFTHFIHWTPLVENGEKNSLKSLLIWCELVYHLLNLFPPSFLHKLSQRGKTQDLWVSDRPAARTLDNLSFGKWKHPYREDKEREKEARERWPTCYSHLSFQRTTSTSAWHSWKCTFATEIVCCPTYNINNFNK